MLLQALCSILYPLVNSNWSYSPETPNLGQIRRFLELCDLEIWRMTLKNNRAPLLSITKLYASSHHHLCIQTGVTVRKRLSWVLTSVTLTFDLWPWPFAWSSLSRCACLLDSGGTIWLLWVYRDPVGIKIDSVGTSTRKWPVPTLYRLMYLHILMSMRLKGGKLLPPSSEDNTCVARKCIPYFFGIYFEYLCACTKLRVW